MSELNNRERSLVSLGAAIASNCVPCIEYHIPGAKRAGISDVQINEALQIADKVRQVPARMVLETARARIDTSPDGSADSVSDPDDFICGAGRNLASITAYGDVRACLQIVRSAGNVLDAPFRDIWAGSMPRISR